MTSDELIEAMARAIANTQCEYDQGALSKWITEWEIGEAATAALKALRDTLEPVGWRYDCIKPIGNREHLDPSFYMANRANMDPRYWTETPLYALPEVKQ